jgi:hypothetical protein
MLACLTFLLDVLLAFFVVINPICSAAHKKSALPSSAAFPFGSTSKAVNPYLTHAINIH